MTTEQKAVQDYWLSIFPEESPAPSTDQVNQWLQTYGMDETLTGLRISVRKHHTMTAKGQSMTLPQFLAYATAVMRNRKDSTLPAPRLLCDSCGKAISEHEEQPVPMKTEMIQ